MHSCLCQKASRRTTARHLAGRNFVTRGGMLTSNLAGGSGLLSVKECTRQTQCDCLLDFGRKTQTAGGTFLTFWESMEGAFLVLSARHSSASYHDHPRSHHDRSLFTMRLHYMHTTIDLARQPRFLSPASDAQLTSSHKARTTDCFTKIQSRPLTSEIQISSDPEKFRFECFFMGMSMKRKQARHRAEQSICKLRIKFWSTSTVNGHTCCFGLPSSKIEVLLDFVTQTHF